MVTGVSTLNAPAGKTTLATVFALDTMPPLEPMVCGGVTGSGQATRTTARNGIANSNFFIHLLLRSRFRVMPDGMF